MPPLVADGAQDTAAISRIARLNGMLASLRKQPSTSLDLALSGCHVNDYTPLYSPAPARKLLKQKSTAEHSAFCEGYDTAAFGRPYANAREAAKDNFLP